MCRRQIWKCWQQDVAILVNVFGRRLRGDLVANKLGDNINFRSRCKEQMSKLNGINAKVAICELDVPGNNLKVSFKRDEVVPVQFACSRVYSHNLWKI